MRQRSEPTGDARITFPSRRGNRLAGLHRAARAGSPAVILCHGMESTKEGTKHRLLADRLFAEGLSVLRFDFSYVGESEGEFADLTFRGEVEDLGGAWDFVASQAAGRVGLVGSSMGGAVALLFAADEPRVAAIVTIAAVGEPMRSLAELHPTELDRWRTEGWLSLGGVRLKRSFLDDVETLDVIGACRKVRCPTLVTHGDADRVVPVDDARAIAGALAGEHTLRIFPGADHRFSRESDLSLWLDETTAWLVRHLGGDAA